MAVGSGQKKKYVACEEAEKLKEEEQEKVSSVDEVMRLKLEYQAALIKKTLQQVRDEKIKLADSVKELFFEELLIPLLTELKNVVAQTKDEEIVEKWNKTLQVTTDERRRIFTESLQKLVEE